MFRLPQSTQIQIQAPTTNMANLVFPTTMGSTYKRGLYWFNTTSGSPLYIHMKTNIPKDSDKMFYIEAEGYNYGTALPVLCSWCGYTWSGSGTLYSTNLTNFYTGMSADGIYYSTDNFVVIRAYASSHYFNGFILNSVTANPVGTFDVQITAASQNSTSGSHY